MELIETIRSAFSKEVVMMIATIIGTLLTVIGTGVTLWHANKVKKYREQIAFDLRKIHLSEIVELLKRVQDEGRKLITQIQKIDRGKNVIVITETIQGYIDNSLNLLPLTGLDNDVRIKILNAQMKLRDFQNTTRNKSECVSNMHSLIQDSISLCKERVSNLDLGGNNE